MKFILHVGMGKTGTSSIQNVLKARTDQLHAQNVHYLGMWFVDTANNAQNIPVMREVLHQPPGEQAKSAHDFADRATAEGQEAGAQTLIFSNEMLFNAGQHFQPFLDVLAERFDLKILAYMRDPHQWLPSAFSQWGIRHKFNTGPLKPFSTLARDLIGQYDGVRFWAETYGDIFELRKHDTSVDVVQDFAAACGIEIDPGDARFLERSEPAETVMRAAFNARFEEEVLPHRFNRILSGKLSEAHSVDHLMEICFGQDGGAEIVAERAELFDYITKTFGPDFDFSSDTSRAKDGPDANAIRERLLEYLLELSIRQGHRITALENKLRKFMDGD
ncbi:MAG: hypothetical protein ACE369_17615 [Roseovarius sp.]